VSKLSLDLRPKLSIVNNLVFEMQESDVIYFISLQKTNFVNLNLLFLNELNETLSDGVSLGILYIHKLDAKIAMLMEIATMPYKKRVYKKVERKPISSEILLQIRDSLTEFFKFKR
jgi:hypothetical protein